MSERVDDQLHTIDQIAVVERILEVICRTTGLGFSAVARVTDTRWIACAVRDEISFGLKPGGELQLETTICNEIRQHGNVVAIDHVLKDLTYCTHPTPKLYGFQSYISVPIVLPGGVFFGTLCAIDPRPARVTSAETVSMFKLFAELIAMHLDAQQRIRDSEAALLTEREAAQLREQFIAVLGHDLRNPLAAITYSAEVLRRFPSNPKAPELLNTIKSSAGRMAALINDVLDFARGKLGGGLTLHRIADTKLPAVLEQVVSELQASWPDRTIEKRIDVKGPIVCESARIAQLLSNLLANALTHGDPAGPVLVEAKRTETEFVLSVTNTGKTIPPEVIDSLFKPFSRGSVRPGQQGLGLGLYIATEIAHAHGGQLGVHSVDGVTRFTFSMPLDQ